MNQSVFIEPIDILFLRGNRLFADVGHSEALMPPWPSLFAGAIRSRILVDQGVSFDAFARGEAPSSPVASSLGRPDAPGTFSVRSVALAKKNKAGDSLYYPLPQDLVATAEGVSALEPTDLRAHEIRGSFALSLAPVLRQATRVKALSDRWIDHRGLELHLSGERVGKEHIVERAALWSIDQRLGIALSSDTRSATEGMIYTSDAVALTEKAGFVVSVEGAGELLPASGLLRLGGDGRGASIAPWTGPSPDFGCRPGKERFRIVTATPGIFPGGWVPPGIGEGFTLSVGGLRARLVAAAVSRGEVISGWDLAKRVPKPAMRVVPAGSVYWFERVSGSTAELELLASNGLWPLMDPLDPEMAARRAEGFNRVWIGA